GRHNPQLQWDHGSSLHPRKHQVRLALSSTDPRSRRLPVLDTVSDQHRLHGGTDFMIKRTKDDERGAVVIITAISMLMIMAALALAVDIGDLVWRKREIQG